MVYNSYTQQQIHVGVRKIIIFGFRWGQDGLPLHNSNNDFNKRHLPMY